MESWQAVLSKAVEYQNRSDKLLQKALRILLKDKGLPEDDFYVCFASGTETIVHYQNETHLSDLDMSFMASMTADEIKKYFGIQEI